jgi:hypothetical protein
MLLAGIQANCGLDPRLKHSRTRTLEKVIRGPLDTPQLGTGDSSYAGLCFGNREKYDSLAAGIKPEEIVDLSRLQKLAGAGLFEMVHG